MDYDPIWPWIEDTEINWGFENSASVLTQYSGIKDKDGTEIYEGDILEFGYTEQSIGKDGKPENRRIQARAKVVFYEGMFCLQWPGEDGYINKYPLVGTYKVVGNIFQNPELFKN